MKIEVACKDDDSNKKKGDLLESLSKKLLKAYGYYVIEEIRIVGAELDLLCEHKVNGKKIYVECKAQKAPIAAPILRQLWGTVDSEEYTEGWLISTSDFTKDAKGFIEKWKTKPENKSSRLSFYSPNHVISSLQDSSIITTPPTSKAEEFVSGSEFLGDWTLLVTKYGIFWCVYTLKGGTPYGVLVYNASNGRQIEEKETLDNLSSLETVLADFDLNIGLQKKESSELKIPSKLPTVIEVQTGESWNDYRPARPQDFVGRDSTQKDIFNFLESAKNSNGSRVFAITGNSGLGKSSLIAKLRDRSKNQHYKKKYFVYAVDIRGARSPLYILSSFISCLKEAQKNGFGDKMDLNLTDPTTPLSSPNIQKYFDSLEAKGQVICLVFDQFEELYSKPELFGVFKSARDLMLDVAGSKRNFVLGFAWKTDSTTHQDHPAYHMWHELSDHRREYRLDVFDNGEISKSITKFQKEIGHNITAETRHQITQSSQGFPWLLKKLCINLHEGIIKGEGSESILVDLDAGRIFESDLELLSPQELTCLKLVAQKAPADWSEIIEISGISILNNLVNKRLVVRSGDRLNIYWDIFKDYLLTGRTPIIPFNYIPTSDPSSMLNICKRLVNDRFIDSIDLAKEASLKDRTIWNIGADLVMFGLAERDSIAFKLHRNMHIYTEEVALKLLRDKLNKHSLKILLYKKYAGKTIQQNDIKETLIESLPKAKFGEKTWSTYSNKLTNFLIYSGFLSRAGKNVIVQDSGSPISNIEQVVRSGKQRGNVFSVSVSPYSVYEAIEAISKGTKEVKDVSRNALTVLKRFELVSLNNDYVTIQNESIKKYGGKLEAIWSVAKNEGSLNRCVEILTETPKISNKDLAERISDEFQLNWSEGSKTRNGGILSQWSRWIKEGIETSSIPIPPGRSNKS
ncbi:restriction endonuclease [Arcobacter sp. CECT 8985]|uniref:restriction endonuclease n=1 Tax=Arcobacter sp. CECT 8985 TaxID=1935424 RepID=UPI00100B3856|nr:restriction endonuclease [Arcobacter sp. CECT 8985]RXJ87781.1 restriction endonuclease [Arcobacter sp. CECT 8985]